MLSSNKILIAFFLMTKFFNKEIKMEQNITRINEFIVSSYIKDLGSLLLKNIKYDLTENVLFTKKSILDAFKVLVSLGWTRLSVETTFGNLGWCSIIIDEIEF